MRLGCFGCLGLLLLIGALIAGIGGPIWLAVHALQEPDIPPVATTADDDARVQHKIYQLVGGGEKHGGRTEPVVLTEVELNAFLSRHLTTTAELPLEEIRARLPGRGQVELAGRVPLRYVVDESPLSALGTILPSRWLGRRVWLQLRTHARLEAGPSNPRHRYLRLDVEHFALGQQGLPVIVLRLVLDPAALRLLRWRVPDSVDAIAVEPGRAIIRTASSR